MYNYLKVRTGVFFTLEQTVYIYRTTTFPQYGQARHWGHFTFRARDNFSYTLDNEG